MLDALLEAAESIVPGCDAAEIEILGTATAGDQTADNQSADDPRSAHRQPRGVDVIRLSLLSGSMDGGGELLGVLALTARREPFGPEAAQPAALLARLAAACLTSQQAHERREDGLRRAMNSRSVIGQAAGVLMAQGDVDQAFRILTRASQRIKPKLGESVRPGHAAPGAASDPLELMNEIEVHKMAPTPENGGLLVDCELVDGDAVLTLKGELDVGTVGRLAEVARRAAKTAPRRIVFDLSELDFIDGSGLHELVRVRERQRNGGGDAVLRRPTSQTMRVLEISGLVRVFALTG